MDDPEAWAKLWDEEMKLASGLAGFKNNERFRTERFVFDIQISAGT